MKGEGFLSKARGWLGGAAAEPPGSSSEPVASAREVGRGSGSVQQGFIAPMAPQPDTAPGAASKGRKNKAVTVVLLLGLAGILLIWLSDCGGKPTAQTKTEQTSESVSTAYADTLEQRVRQLVVGLTGDEAAEVMVTLAQSVEYIYEYETKSSSEQTPDSAKNTDERSVVYVEDENGRDQALLRKVLEPKIAGVVVICTGGDAVTVRSRVIQAVSTALSVSTDKVFVAERATAAE